MEDNNNENSEDKLVENNSFVEISKTKFIAGALALSMISSCFASMLTKNIMDNQIDDPLLIALSEYIEYRNKNQVDKSFAEEDLIEFFNSFNDYLYQGNDYSNNSTSPSR